MSLATKLGAVVVQRCCDMTSVLPKVALGQLWFSCAQMLGVTKPLVCACLPSQLYYLPLVAMAAAWAASGALGLSSGAIAGGITLVSCAMCIASIGCLSHQTTARTGGWVGGWVLWSQAAESRCLAELQAPLCVGGGI